MSSKFNLESITNQIGFLRTAKAKKEIEFEILYLSKQISSAELTSDEYEATIKQLNALIEIKQNMSNKNIKLDLGDVLKLVGTGVTAGAGILGVMMTLKYENSDEIITSKAFNVASKMIGK